MSVFGWREGPETHVLCWCKCRTFIFVREVARKRWDGYIAILKPQSGAEGLSSPDMRNVHSTLAPDATPSSNNRALERFFGQLEG